MKKALKIMLIFFIVIMFLNISSYANYSISEIFTDAQNFIEVGEQGEDKINETALKNTSSFIFNLLYSIGMVAAVAVGIVLGIQFMVASAEDKAKVKETLVGYTIGCLVLFGAYPLWKIAIEIIQSVTRI